MVVKKKEFPDHLLTVRVCAVSMSRRWEEMAPSEVKGWLGES